MSFSMLRVGAIVGSATLLAVAIASAQERQAGEPAGGPSADVNVFNSIEGRMMVVSSRPDGARVEKGEVVIELDPSELKDRMASQEIAVRAAEAHVQGARLAREVASIALTQYQEGLFVLAKASSEGEIKLAETQLARSVDRVDWARRMYDKGYLTMAEKVSEELVLKKARFGLEVAESKLRVLLEYTKGKTIKERQSEIETAQGRELAKQASFERERSALKKLEDQLRRCKIAAPVGGRIRYTAPIGTGAVVHDGQLVFQVIPDGAAGTTTK